MEDGEVTKHGVHDFYVYVHLPLAISLAAAAVGLEHVVLHGADPHVDAGPRWLLGIAISGYLLSAAVMQAHLSGSVRGAVLWPGAGILLALIIALLDLSPIFTVGVLAAGLVAGVLTGFLLHRSGEVRTAKV
jgi:low temperature requirement protein LtrA